MCFCNCPLPFILAERSRANVSVSPPADPHSASNGNHESFSCNSDATLNNISKKLQDSLVLKTSLSSSGFGKQPLQSSHADIFNGRNGSTAEYCINENSISLTQNIGSKRLPVPARSAQTNLAPVPHPRTSLSVAFSGTGGGQRSQESPKPLRNVRAEATSSPKPHVRGSGQGTENSSLSHKPSSIKFSQTAPSSPQLRGSSLQKRSSSPMREQGQFLSHVDVPQRPVGSTSLRELPPLSPSMSRRGTPLSQGVLESPQGHRKLATPSKSEAVYTQRSSSPPGHEKEPGSRQLKTGPGSTFMSSLGSVSGLSPLASPHSQRKTSCMRAKGSASKEGNVTKPYTRERKNSISEISDNEDELLEYHRWQREERLREQEMEKLVSDQAESRYGWILTPSPHLRWV